VALPFSENFTSDGGTPSSLVQIGGKSFFLHRRKPYLNLEDVCEKRIIPGDVPWSSPFGRQDPLMLLCEALPSWVCILGTEVPTSARQPDLFELCHLWGDESASVSSFALGRGSPTLSYLLFLIPPHVKRAGRRLS